MHSSAALGSKRNKRRGRAGREHQVDTMSEENELNTDEDSLTQTNEGG